MPWAIMHDDPDVLITGPGGFEITLRDFDAALGQRDELPPEALGSLLQRQWRYLGRRGVAGRQLNMGDTAESTTQAVVNAEARRQQAMKDIREIMDSSSPLGVYLPLDSAQELRHS